MSWHRRKTHLAKRDAWWERQRADMQAQQANAAAPPGTLAWGLTFGPELCQHIRDHRPDIATWPESNHEQDANQSNSVT